MDDLIPDVYKRQAGDIDRSVEVDAHNVVPDTVHPVTDKLPAAIEVTESYAPRFIDRCV